MPKRSLVLEVIALAVFLAPTAVANASDLTSLDIQALDYPIGPYTFRLGGQVNGSAYATEQPASAHLHTVGVTGAASAAVKVERLYEDGLDFELKGVFDLYHDRLSGDLYGNKFVEKLYTDINAGVGRFELGNVDGAAYELAVTGPVADDDISLDSSTDTFFRDPTTNSAFVKLFPVTTAIRASLNYAKVSYYTPRLFGFELGASFTPSEARGVVPFVASDPDIENRQDDMWEFVGSYAGYYGAWSVGAFSGIAVARNAARTALHTGLEDWAAGAELDYAIDDTLKLAIGGAYHQTNAYALNVNSALSGEATHVYHVSALITAQRWLIGTEYIDGSTGNGGHAPALSTSGYEASLGYRVDENLQLTLGWQHRNYGQQIGTFYNDAHDIAMDVAFLHFRFKV